MKKKKEIYNQYKLRMQYMKDYRKTTPYMKLLDKSSFVLGVMMTIMFAYFMGRWPHTNFYTAYTVVIPAMVFIRFVDYKKKGWHYYLTDFCYFGGGVVIMFLAIYPKNMLLYRAAFMFANGALASSTAAFNNALIFHKFDHLISIVTHPVPLICMWNIRQITMEEQKNLPIGEQRFLQHPYDEPFLSYDSLFYNFIVPYGLYFLWAIVYYVFNFKIKKEKISKKNYETLFNYFNSDAVPWAHKKLQKAGKNGPFLFMAYHAAFFTISHIIALVCFYSMWTHSIFVTLYLTIGIWNGSCYYTRFFDYTKKL